MFDATVRNVVLIIALIHLVLVLLISWSVTDSHYHCNPDESFVLWAFFLFLDFPCSIVIMVTSGPCVVSIPNWLFRYGWFVTEVIWPALVCQVVGMVNWTIIIMLLKKIWYVFCALNKNNNRNW